MKAIAIAVAALALSAQSAAADMRLCQLVNEHLKLRAESLNVVMTEIGTLRGSPQQPVMDRVFGHLVSVRGTKDRQLEEIDTICLEIISQTVDQLRESTPQ